MSHDALAALVRLAYSAERAACYAYASHAASVSDPQRKAAIKRIEHEEWEHRDQLGRLMTTLQIRPSRWLEVKYALMGRVIGLSCFVIGRFMPNYFAGRLESGNVNEYLTMQRLAVGSPIAHEHACIADMARVEKEHELFFLTAVRDDAWLPWFQRVFAWGEGCSFNPLPAPAPEELPVGVPA